MHKEKVGKLREKSPLLGGLRPTRQPFSENRPSVFRFLHIFKRLCLLRIQIQLLHARFSGVMRASWTISSL